jgi:hypothetical protein
MHLGTAHVCLLEIHRRSNELAHEITVTLFGQGLQGGSRTNEHRRKALDGRTAAPTGLQQRPQRLRLPGLVCFPWSLAIKNHPEWQAIVGGGGELALATAPGATQSGRTHMQLSCTNGPTKDNDKQTNTTHTPSAN